MSDFQIETYKSRITLSIEVIRLLATVNGGGAIAVLTYAGNAHHRLDPSALWYALAAYGFGLAFAVLIALVAYIVQAYVDSNTTAERPTGVVSGWMIFGACLLVVASLSAFVVGSLHAADAISAAVATPT